MTADDAIALIEAAADPRTLFGRDPGRDPGRDYRRLARLTHPDAHPGSSRAAAAFAKLAELWQRYRTGLGPLVAGGDIANLYEHERGLLKLARDPADNDLLDREAGALTRLHTGGDSRYLPYIPSLISAELHQDPASGIRRRANVISRLEGFVPLAAVHAAYPRGLDPRDVAWMWRRLLVAIGFAHRAGVIHAAVLPSHVLIHPAAHGLVLVDWCYSISKPAAMLAAVPTSHAAWYPGEALSHRSAGPDLDIYLATRCMTQLLAGRAPRQLAAFARGCTLPGSARRPQDAWRLLGELDDVLGRLYGPRKFRPFAMPA